MSKYPEKVKVVEVGPRDGLQNEKQIISTADKVRFIDLLSDSGLSVIEATSFVSPKWVPQLGDAADVYRAIQKKKGVSYPVLVPNLKGLERALEVGVKDIAVFTAASETFNKKNINMSIDESLKAISDVISAAKSQNLRVRGYVSTCFVCPYEGKIDPQKAASVLQKLFSLGVDEISVGDTIGAATPTDVEKLFETLGSRVPKEKLAVHFHNTYGTALSNIEASLKMGIAIVDSSAGGLGGCPYAPGAAGNVATEDVLNLLHSLGIQTGVDLKKIVQASQFIRDALKR